MKAGAQAPTKAAALRRRAQTRLKKQKRPSVELGSETEVRRLVHALQVHQIELELQNEELKQSALVAEQAVEKYTELYDFAPIGYFSLDREGRITEANLASASMLDLPRSELLNKRFESFVPIAEQAAFREFIAGVFERRRREHCEMSIRSGGDKVIEVRWDSTVSESGLICQVAMVDISGEKQAQRDLLILSQLKSLGVLAGGIAHDFNNLLATILLSVEVAESKLDASSGKVKVYLEEAMRAVFLAQGLTRKFISLTHGGTSAHEFAALPGLIRESVRIGLVDSMVRAEFAVPDDLWTVTVDEVQIGQVIQNVTLNAKESMPGGGTIRVSAENVVLDPERVASLPKGKYVCLRIADEGVGISKEALPKVFEPYFTTKVRGTERGVGLGLTISHAVMQRHKGAITVESEIGAGATFHLYFPVSPET